MFRSILLASVLATATFAAGAHAQDDNSQTVSARNVDFNNPSDVRKLYGQIQDAADAVCDNKASTGSMFTAKQERQCKDYAVNNAVNTLNRPQLTQLAQRRTGDTQLAMRDRHDWDSRSTR